MDMLTLAMAKNYSDSKGGYVERTSELCDNPRTLDAGVLQGNVAISPAIDVGELFAVTINGKRYERRAENGIIDEVERAYIGNLNFVGGSDNGDPFLVYSSAGSRITRGMNTSSTVWTRHGCWPTRRWNTGTAASSWRACMPQGAAWCRPTPSACAAT